MAPDLALVDQALLVVVYELDRIFDRDDVIRSRPVDVVDHRGERRRLAGAGRTGDEHETFLQRTEIQDGWRELELLRRHDARWHLAKHRAHAASVEKHIRAETAEPFHLVGEIRIVTLVEFGKV